MLIRLSLNMAKSINKLWYISGATASLSLLYLTTAIFFLSDNIK